MGLFSNFNASGNVDGLGVFYSNTSDLQSLKFLSNCHKSKAEVLNCNKVLVSIHWSDIVLLFFVVA